jgi:hypothetical protein
MEGEGFRYFVDPQKPVLMSGGRGLHGQYQFIVSLELDGQFLQFRTQHYASCAADNQHLGTTLKVLLALDYQLRFAKFAWDSSDGEVVAYGDIWIADGTLTQTQFSRCLASFVSAIDLNYPRITKAVAEGKDIGQVGSGGISPTMSDSLSAKLRELLEELVGRGGQPKPDPDISTI